MSITGVLVVPSDAYKLAPGAAPWAVSSSDMLHSGPALAPVLEFASNAYTLPLSVATYTTLCVASLTVIPDRYRGCA